MALGDFQIATTRAILILQCPPGMAPSSRRCDALRCTHSASGLVTLLCAARLEVLLVKLGRANRRHTTRMSAHVSHHPDNCILLHAADAECLQTVRSASEASWGPMRASPPSPPIPSLLPLLPLDRPVPSLFLSLVC